VPPTFTVAVVGISNSFLKAPTSADEISIDWNSPLFKRFIFIDMSKISLFVS
jgi:hypothetical protein